MSVKSERTPPTPGGGNPLERYGLNAYLSDGAIEVRTMGPRSDLMSGGTPDDYRSLVAVLERETARIKSEIVADALAGKLGDVRGIKHYAHFPLGLFGTPRHYGYGGRDIDPSLGYLSRVPDMKRDVHLVALASEPVVGKGLKPNPELVPPAVVLVDAALAAVKHWIADGGLKRACRVAILRSAPDAVAPAPAAGPDVVGELTHDQVRLPGSVCTAPQDHEVDGGKVWAWDYYRTDCASRFATRVTVNLKPDGSGLSSLHYHDPDGNPRMAGWKPIAAGGGVEAARRLAAEGVETLQAVAPLPWEFSLGRAALFDAGFHTEEAGRAEGGTLMVRTRDDGVRERVDGLVEYGVAEDGSFEAQRRDVVDDWSEAVTVSLVDPTNKGETVTRCESVADALAVLDDRLLPTPSGVGTTSFDRDDLAAPAPR